MTISMTPSPLSVQTSRWCARLANAHPEWLPKLTELALRPLDAAALQALLQTERCGSEFHPEFNSDYRDGDYLASVLRRVRNQALFVLIERDLSGQADLQEVMTAMTALAEITVQAALAYWTGELVKVHGAPIGRLSGQRQELVVVGMGKLGGVELNVSSDIDLIFIYLEDGETVSVDGAVADIVDAPAVKTLSNHEFFTLLGRKLIGALSEATADGFVFRVDMRLRPNGDSGPLAISCAMLEEYFLKQGRDWERFAWIKGRIVSCPTLLVPSSSGAGAASSEPQSLFQQTTELDSIVRPFVYRRYLDFGAIAALRNLHGQIRAEVQRQEARAARTASGELSDHRPVNVKLGRGGIREVEFIVQHFQLIRGGRDPELRNRSTLTMLKLLVQKNLLDVETAERLATAYVFLRNVEHRLQYLDDAQTHVLPRESEARARVAAMCAPYLDATDDPVAALEARIAHEQAFVAEVFDEVFGAKAVASSQPVGSERAELWGEALTLPITDAASTALKQLGYTDPEAVWSRLRALWSSRALRFLTVPSRERIDLLLPGAIEAAVHSPHADALARTAVDTTATLGRLLDLIEAISGRGPYVSFLNEFPQALQRVVRVLAASPWAARYLTRHPLLLDELIDSREHAPPDCGSIKQSLHAELARASGDSERQMDILRETHHAQVFRLLMQDLAGTLTVEALSDHLSALADLIVDAALGVAWQQLSGQTLSGQPLSDQALSDQTIWQSGQRHRETPRFAVIAYGKLGGKELGYASDLDIIFLYDDEHERAGEIYARLAQRLITVLTTRTTAGTLFEIDLALRPDGGSGLLVSSLAAYRKYQNESAWVWEHQALTRTRFSAGDAELGVAFEEVRRSVLAKPRDIEKLREEITAMRKKMQDAHPTRKDQFDLKHDAGGMIDIEFVTQYLVLAYGHAHPELLDDVGNIALLQRAGAVSLIDPALALKVADAYRAYRKRQHALRLAESSSDVSGVVEGKAARVDASEFVEERQGVRCLWRGLFE